MLPELHAARLATLFLHLFRPTEFHQRPSARFRRRIAAFCQQSRVMLRSEEHTSELQSRPHLVCRLLLEKKKSAPPWGSSVSGRRSWCCARPSTACVAYATATAALSTLSLRDALPIPASPRHA